VTAIASVAVSEKAAAKRLANLRPFKPGQSGNPGGRLSNGKRYQELFAAIAGEFGGESELTAMEREFVSRAAEQLRRAERAKSNNELVRLTRCAAQLIDRVREKHRRESAPREGARDTEREDARTPETERELFPQTDLWVNEGNLLRNRAGEVLTEDAFRLKYPDAETIRLNIFGDRSDRKKAPKRDGPLPRKG
jgi:hypothetical protein